jgi:hypothetical protein
MRNWIIGAAAAFAVVAAPSVAAAQTGYVGANYASTDFGAGDEIDSYGVEGAVAFSGSGSIVFEVDAALTDSDDADSGYGLLGHVYSRNDSHLFGGFVGIAGSDDSETYVAGLEAAKYFANWTLAGAVAYGNNDEADVDGYGVNVEGRLFVHDNLRLNGNIGWASTDSGTGDDDDAMVYGVGGEYQFSAIPVSIALGYNTVDFDGGDVDTWSVALRYNWGGTLRDRDRNGASQASIVGISSAFAS